ncbi:Cysteine-rich receptor-like protein kinase 3 [Glycine soja]
MAPAYLIRGQLTDKADVYGYGVLVLEIVSGRRNNAFREDSGSLLQTSPISILKVPVTVITLASLAFVCNLWQDHDFEGPLKSTQGSFKRPRPKNMMVIELPFNWNPTVPSANFSMKPYRNFVQKFVQ